MTELLAALILLPNSMFKKLGTNAQTLGESAGDALAGVIGGLEKLDSKTNKPSNNQQDKDEPPV